MGDVGGRVLQYRPGLDGVRALAVAGVLLYHGHVRLLRGGFAGVDVFFVLSGFLITSLLLQEHAVEATVRLGRFWLTRARRLLPAALLTIVVSLLVVAIFFPSDLKLLRGDSLASVFYVNNWHQILAKRSYFESFARPSLLQHFWSLAVEEQFYLLWPPILLVLLRRRVRPQRIALGVLAASALSALLMALLFNGSADHTRIYFGTDTHASAILLGVALGCYWPSMRRVRSIGISAKRLLDLCGAGGLALVLVAMTSWPDYSPFVYRGGLVIAAIGAALLIASASHPATTTGRLLGSRPLVWIGRRSYGIYLWHWPVMALTRPDIDVHMPLLVLVALQTAVTVAIATLSYRYMEMPIRRGVLQARLLRWRRSTSNARRTGLGFATAAVSIAFLLVIATWPAPARQLPRLSASLAASRAPAVSAASKQSVRPGVLAVGASVMRQAQDALENATHAQIDAADSRQPDVILQRLKEYRDSHALPDTVVVQTGENSPISDKYLDQLRGVLSGVPHVVIVNLRYSGESWIDDTNAQLKRFVASWPQATLADWYAASSDSGLLWDGAHPNPQGQRVYAQTIANAIAQPPGQHSS